MRMTLKAETRIPCVTVDFLMVRCNGREERSLNWETSAGSLENGIFEAEYDGLCLDEEVVCSLDSLDGMHITTASVYSDAERHKCGSPVEESAFRIVELTIYGDDGSELSIPTTGGFVPVDSVEYTD